MNELTKSQHEIVTFSEEKVSLLKNTVCKGATDSELQLFLHVCQKTGLDPFMRQIYSIARGGQRTIQTGIDGLRLIAERTGRYAPGKETIFVYDEKKNLLSSTSFIKKMTADGKWHEVSATAFFAEFNPGNNPMWKKMPHVMLSKCSEASALRKAFPAELSGIYAGEEMDQATPIHEEIAVVEKKEEDPLVIKEKLDRFLSPYNEDDQIFCVEYLEKYCAHWKKNVLQALEDYSDPEKFDKDFNKWKKKNHGT